MKIKLVLLFISITTLFSCSVEKRHYTSGWNIQWYDKLKATDPIIQNDSVVIAQNKSIATATDTSPSHLHAPLKTNTVFAERTLLKKFPKKHVERALSPNNANITTPQHNVDKKNKPEDHTPPSKNKNNTGKTLISVGAILGVIGFICLAIGFSKKYFIGIFLDIGYLLLLSAIIILLLGLIFAIISASKSNSTGTKEKPQKSRSKSVFNRYD